MTDELIKRLQEMLSRERECSVCDGDGIRTNLSDCKGCGGSGRVCVYAGKDRATIAWAANRLSELTAPVRVTVKPLEWKLRSSAFDDEWKAETVVGRYDVGLVHVGFTAVRRSVDGNDAADTVLARGVGVEQAKAAAQADYEQRILSALELSPQGAGEEGWSPRMDAVIAVAKDLAEHLLKHRPSDKEIEKAALFLHSCIERGALSPLCAAHTQPSSPTPQEPVASELGVVAWQHRLRTKRHSIWSEWSEWLPGMADRQYEEALHQYEDRPLVTLDAATRIIRALEAERDELDFLLNEGGSWEAQLRSVEDRAEKAEALIAELVELVETLTELFVDTTCVEDPEHENSVLHARALLAKARAS